jgi:hypothetical protein
MSDEQSTAGEASAQEELRALRAQAAEAQARREQLQAQREAELELATVKRQLRDEQVLAKLIEEHGPVGVKLATVDTPLGLVILRPATPLKFRRFQDKGSFSYDDVCALVRPCVLHPPPGELDALLDEYPATLTRIGSAVVSLAGHRMDDVAKK